MPGSETSRTRVPPSARTSSPIRDNSPAPNTTRTFDPGTAAGGAPRPFESIGWAPRAAGAEVWGVQSVNSELQRITADSRGDGGALLTSWRAAARPGTLRRRGVYGVASVSVV